MALRIRLLRDVSIEGDDLSRAVSLTPKARALLTILALRHAHPVPIDDLIERLWPGRPRERAIDGLRVLVSEVRRALGTGELIEAGQGAYRLIDSGLVFDFDEFETAASAGREAVRNGAFGAAVDHLERALALYRGDLVEAQAYEDWATGVRARLRERRIGAQEDLADALIALGRPRDAVDILERVLEQDRVREGAYQRLMRAHVAAGEQSEALRAYERLRAALDEELGVDPLPETMRLHERVLRREPLGTPLAARALTRTDTETGSLVGRDLEEARLETALARGATGGHLVLVVGEPGIGKTILVRSEERRVGKECRL